MIEAQINNATVVLVGKFNPAIFSPAWLSRVQLIKNSEADAAQVAVIHPELTQMKVGVFDLQIGPKRLAVGTLEVPFLRVADFVADLIGKILPHTPVTALGINFEEHFNTPTPEHRIKLGRILAPVDPWGEWGKAIALGTGEKASGLKMLVMQETSPDGREGWFTVEIGPSPELNRIQSVKLSSNDHYVIKESGIASSAEIAATILVENFEKSQIKSKKIFSHVRDLSENIKL